MSLHIYIRVLCQIDPETWLIIATLGHTLFIEIMRSTIDFMIVRSIFWSLWVITLRHTPFIEIIRSYADFMVARSICWCLQVITEGMYHSSLSSSSQLFLHFESLSVVFFFGYRSYLCIHFLLVFNVLGYKLCVPSSYILLDYHFP